MSALLRTQVAVLARRAMLKTLRQPFQLFPIIFFPVILLAVNASGLKAATRLPGFPTHSYISFAIAVAFIQGAMFSLINTGTNLAEDVPAVFIGKLGVQDQQIVVIAPKRLEALLPARRLVDLVPGQLQAQDRLADVLGSVVDDQDPLLRHRR